MRTFPYDLPSNVSVNLSMIYPRINYYIDAQNIVVETNFMSHKHMDTYKTPNCRSIRTILYL